MTKQTVELTLTSEEDTQALARKLALAGISGSVWLSGDLGAGKTTLTRYWLRELGHTGAVKSPTYTLVEPYDLSHCQLSSHATIQSGVKTVYHADLYRLQDPEELSFIGFEEYLEDDDALIIIEWASRAKQYLPKPVMTIHIKIVKNESEDEVRQVSIDYEDDASFDASRLGAV